LTAPARPGADAPAPAPSDAAAADAALLDAARAGRLADVEALLAADPGAAARARDGAGDRAVVAAAFRGHRAVAERVAAALGPAQLEPWEAALVGDAAALARHVDAEPSLAGARRADGWPLLHLAGFYGHPDVVDVLVARGADVRARAANDIGNTALHAVFAMSGDLRVAERLLAAGADVNARGGGGYTPLHLAAARGHLAGVELLLSRGADASAGPPTGAPPRPWPASAGTRASPSAWPAADRRGAARGPAPRRPAHPRAGRVG
jgi:hypothetical protein